jgi:uncharacterized protein
LKPFANIDQFIIKIASRCNLNCSYCYVYNKADTTWKHKPALMSDATFETVLERIRRYCLFTGQSVVNIVFHGGEPCLIGAKKFNAWCVRARQVLEDVATVALHMQTNGTLLDDSWIEACSANRVGLGISMDGPAQVHDLFRVDHSGRGSYQQVERAIKLLQSSDVSYGILSVIPLGADPLTVHRHFLALGCTQITYVLPHFTHDTIAPIRRRYGSTPCADFLIPVFDDWWFNCTADIHIGDLRNMARIIMGGSSRIETVGNEPPLYVFVESDGEMEGLDNLRACKDGMTKINLNVGNNDFQEILQTETMHGKAIYEGMPLPEGCRSCPERDTCAGGYLPHRYSSSRGFDNPSVWCADLLKIFTHIRSRLGVTVQETRERRQALQNETVAACM